KEAKLMLEECEFYHLHDPRCQALEVQSEGTRLALAGKVAEATKKFRKANALDPALQIDEKNAAAKLLAQVRVEEGNSLARQDKLSEAIAKLQEAKSLDPTLHIDPQND